MIVLPSLLASVHILTPLCSCVLAQKGTNTSCYSCLEATDYQGPLGPYPIPRPIDWAIISSYLFPKKTCAETGDYPLDTMNMEGTPSQHLGAAQREIDPEDEAEFA